MDAKADWYWDLENWYGSFLEVAIDLGDKDDERLRKAVAAAWKSPGMVGPLDSPYVGQDHGRSEGLLDDNKTYGTIELPNTRRRIGCEVITVRDEESDWLDVAVPTGMLELAFEVDYPLAGATNPWIAGVEGLLVSIADAIYSVVPFDLATVGEEVSGVFYARSSDVDLAINREEISRHGGFLISPDLWDRLQPTVAAEALPTGLLWVPPRW